MSIFIGMASYISLIIAVLGFIPLLIVLWKRSRIKKLKQTGDLVTGVVEDVIERIGAKGSRYHHVIIQYRVFGNRTLRGTYVYAGSRKRPLYLPRQSVELYYDKNKPEKFIPKNGGNYTVALVLTILFAIAYCVLAFFLYNYIKNPGGY